MARTEAQILRDEERTGAQDAENVADDPRAMLDQFFPGNPARLRSMSVRDVEDVIARSLEDETIFDIYAEKVRDSLSADEHLSDAAMRRALKAWARGWARVAAPDVIRYAKRDADDARENPTRKRRVANRGRSRR